MGLRLGRDLRETAITGVGINDDCLAAVLIARKIQELSDLHNFLMPAWPKM